MAAAAVAAPGVLRECGCKGIRTCLMCERQRGGDRPWQHSLQKTHCFIYYSDTGWAVGAEESDFEGWAFPFPGVTLIEDFVTREEEAEMVQLMDREPWKLSQSGRRKQDYGPKVNFRKQKLKTTGFTGLPSFSREVVQRMGLYPVLEDFQPVEQCNLDYCPERGSAIDPHLDDTWLWGERLPHGTSGGMPSTADTSRAAACAPPSGSCRPSSGLAGGSKTWGRNSCKSLSPFKGNLCEPLPWRQELAQACLGRQLQSRPSSSRIDGRRPRAWVFSPPSLGFKIDTLMP
ncbi:Alpha-Ketoglutarate-Dependent Dioxygenase Alkb 4 [Manis pentadactyla]|nr:Alpha-Ketoglutarate-Dependent Dioxygenase Alkb 4 [Manis pentadactyla]